MLVKLCRLPRGASLSACATCAVLPERRGQAFDTGLRRRHEGLERQDRALAFDVLDCGTRIEFCCFSPSGEYIVCAKRSASGTHICPVLLRATDGTTVVAESTFVTAGEPRSACFSPDGTRLAVGYMNGGVVALFDVPALQHRSKFGVATPLRLSTPLAFHAEGATLLVGSELAVEAWDVASGGRVRHLWPRRISGWAPCRLSVSPDSRLRLSPLQATETSR